MLTNWLPRLAFPCPRGSRGVREIREWSELADLREAWETLYEATPDADFFRSWDWFVAYWRHFGSSQQLRVLVVGTDEAVPRGIVPLTLRTQPSRIGSIRRLGFPLDHWGVQYGPLGSRPAEILAEAVRYLARHSRRWDVLELQWIPRELVHDYAGGLGHTGLRFQQKPWSQTRGIDLSRGWDHFWNSRTSKWRNNQRRNDKVLAQCGQVEVVHFRPPPGASDPRWDWYEQCEQVARKSWQGSSPTGNTLSDPSVREFLREAHLAAVRHGAVHLSLLRVNHRPAAFTYNYHRHGLTFGLRTGYDPEFHHAGPGAVLMRETVRESCRRGDRVFHLGESPSPYKQQWADREFQTVQFCHYSPFSPRGQALRWSRWLKSHVPVS